MSLENPSPYQTEANPEFDKVLKHMWGHTVDAKERLLKNINQAKYFEEAYVEGKYVDKFKDRPLIARDRPILGGVYVGAGEREAIVVDEKYGELLPIYAELLKRREQAIRNGGNFKTGLLSDVWELTKEKIPYDQSIVSKIDALETQEEDYKIALDSYIRNQGGVCRHQALLAGYLLEKLATQGLVGGRVSIDRNSVPGLGGHAWVRYTNSHGNVYILDPAQDYIGPLGGEENKTRWFYERPEDLNEI